MANEAAISTLAGQISDCIIFSDAAITLMIRGIRTAVPNTKFSATTPSTLRTAW